jgi:hypothetical protein
VSKKVSNPALEEALRALTLKRRQPTEANRPRRRSVKPAVIDGQLDLYGAVHGPITTTAQPAPEGRGVMSPDDIEYIGNCTNLFWSGAFQDADSDTAAAYDEYGRVRVLRHGDREVLVGFDSGVALPPIGSDADVEPYVGFWVAVNQGDRPHVVDVGRRYVLGADGWRITEQGDPLGAARAELERLGAPA